MENASNALIIAGSILIAIIILSIGVILFSSYSKIGESYEQTRVVERLTKYNSNFTIFEERTDITAQEIVTLVNYARNYNEENETSIEVNVQYSNEVNGNLADISKDLLEFIKKNSTKIVINEEGKEEAEIIYFECEEIKDEYYDEEGRIIKIIFKKTT